ncbi:hypothetical protein AA18889_2360 [Acetobacter senegalensis DSM 18889]|nr:hypothetical protein AA18889_2360 [Acetobacter senegalensis DSM 18889]
MTFVSINREAITRTELLTVCAVSNRKSLSKIDLSETGNGCAPFLLWLPSVMQEFSDQY